MKLYLQKVLVFRPVFWTKNKMDLCKVVLFLALLGISCGAESKSPCQGCKDLVDGILKVKFRKCYFFACVLFFNILHIVFYFTK